MALITPASRCAICNRLLGALPYLATSGGDFFPITDPLYPFCDAPLHWDCYEHWPERPRFARQYVARWVKDNSENEYWGDALLTDLVYLSVRRKEPGEAAVWLFETGTCVRVLLSQWSTWLSDLSFSTDPLHRLEIISLRKALPDLRRRFPTPEAVLAAVDWEAKERLGIASELERTLRERARLDAIQRHNDACREFVKTGGDLGLTCPHCGLQSKNIEFIDYSGGDRKSFFVCSACGRSFGHDL